MIVVALIAAGCGGDDDATAPSSTTASTTTVATTTTTEAPLPACPDSELPPSATDVSTADMLDVDGDELTDVVTVYRDGGGRWRRHVAFGRGGGADEALSGTGLDVAGAGAAGGSDVDGDGTTEVWIRTGAGASVQLVSLFTHRDCGLDRLTPDFAVGGSVQRIFGVTCRNDEILVHASESDDGVTYETVTERYRLIDDRLVLTGTTDLTIRSDGPEFSAVSGFRCVGALL